MKALPCVDRDDATLLTTVAHYYPSIAPIVSAMRDAYTEYKASSCVGLSPIGVPATAKGALETAYTSESKRAGLQWISELRTGHSHNACPLCGGLGSRTIDHYLPQAYYPEFSIFSWNLLPSCGTCNQKRGDRNRPGADWTIHPYFASDLLARPLLRMTVSGPLSAPVLSVALVEGLDPAEAARVKTHFDRSVDTEAFSSWARGEWTDLLYSHASRARSGSELRANLRDLLEAEMATHTNSWYAAFLRGVINAPGACDWLVANALSPPICTDAELGIA